LDIIETYYIHGRLQYKKKYLQFYSWALYMFDKTGKVCFLQSDINCERIEAVVNKFSQ